MHKREYFFLIIICLCISLFISCNQEEYTSLEKIQTKADAYLEDILKIKINYCDSIISLAKKGGGSTYTMMDSYSNVCVNYPKDLFLDTDIQLLAFETVSPIDLKFVYIPIIGNMEHDSLDTSGLLHGFGNVAPKAELRSKIKIYNLVYDYEKYDGSYKMVVHYLNPENEQFGMIKVFLYFKDLKLERFEGLF